MITTGRSRARRSASRFSIIRKNPRHPTWWHVRDYGLFAANPFGQHDFEKLPDKTAGNLMVPAGKSVTFRYRFYLHEGDEQQGEGRREVSSST